MELILNLNNRLNWDLVAKEFREAERPKIISPIAVETNSRIIAIGTLSSSAKNHWQIGGWASARLLITPSATSGFNLDTATGLMEFARFPVPLRRLKLVFLEKLEPLPYTLILETARWHRDVYWEVWQYSGVDTDSVSSKLLEIEQKINEL